MQVVMKLTSTPNIPSLSLVQLCAGPVAGGQGRGAGLKPQDDGEALQRRRLPRAAHLEDRRGGSKECRCFEPMLGSKDWSLEHACEVTLSSSSSHRLGPPEALYSHVYRIILRDPPSSRFSSGRILRTVPRVSSTSRRAEAPLYFIYAASRPRSHSVHSMWCLRRR